MRYTSRTWQPYSTADHCAGDGRCAAFGSASSSGHAAAFSRTRSPRRATSTVAGSYPHSGHGRSSTHVQSLSSGTIAIPTTVATVAGPPRAGSRRGLRPWRVHFRRVPDERCDPRRPRDRHATTPPASDGDDAEQMVPPTLGARLDHVRGLL